MATPGLKKVAEDLNGLRSDVTKLSEKVGELAQALTDKLTPVLHKFADAVDNKVEERLIRQSMYVEAVSDTHQYVPFSHFVGVSRVMHSRTEP